MSEAAQNQHYVPKFILRNFLSNPKKESVTVYDKQGDAIFITSIKNIMAERRFHDLRVDEDIRSFEPASNEIESFAIPAYRRVLAAQQLELSSRERTALSILFAFQFVRTRASRNMWKDMAEALASKLNAMGVEQHEISSRIVPNEELAKEQHLLGIVDYMRDFAPCFAEKNWQLLIAPEGRSFYLSDNPVVLHNEKQFGPYGNIGLMVPGIQIYLPLSSRIVLCAQCPTIVGELRQEWSIRAQAVVSDLGRMSASGAITITQGMVARKKFDEINEATQLKLMQLEDGGTVYATTENVDFINSLQVKFATRFVICQRGDFELAQRYNREFPKFRTGVRPVVL